MRINYVMAAFMLWLSWAMWSDVQASEKDVLGIPVESNLLWYATSVAMVADWGTTLDIVGRHDEGYEEANAILGSHPSRGNVNTYFILKLGLGAFINLYRPLRHVKNLFNIPQLYLSWSAVDDNIQAGLNINF